MLKQLSIRNAKRQAREYMIYFITITCTVSFMYGFNALIFSDIVASLPELEILFYMIITISLLIVFILGWLVHYMTNFMLKKRSKELSTYMILGISNKNISKLFFKENFLICGVAFVCGTLFGYLISEILKIIILNLFGIDYQFSISFSIPAIALTGLYFLMIFIFALWKNGRSIRKMKLYDLLYYEKRNENTSLEKTGWMAVVFVISLVFGAGGIGLFMYMPLGKGYDVLLGMVLIVLFLFGFFQSVPGFLAKVFGSRENIKYSKNRLFLLRSFTSKIASLSMTLCMISVLFTLALTAMGVAVSVNEIAGRSIELNVFDIVILSKNPNSDFSGYRSRIEETVPVEADHLYYIYHNEDQTFRDIRAKAAASYSDLPQEIYVEYQYDTYMKYSDYRALCRMLAIDVPQIKENEYIIHCVPALQDAYSEYMHRQVVMNGKTMELNSINTAPFNQADSYGNGMDFIIVVPDEMADKLPVIYQVYTAQTFEPVSSIALENLCAQDERLEILDRNLMVSSSDMGAYGTSIPDSGKDYISGRSAFKKNYADVYSIMIALFYLALIFVITGATILVTQILSDCGKHKKQYDILRHIGMSTQTVNQTVNKQLAAFFLLPVIPAVVISSSLVFISMNIMQPQSYIFPVFEGYGWIWGAIASAVGLLFILYGIYFIAVCKNYKKSII
ncbi:FtsX-like permease family protein [Robinsoniella sp. KNHs210]|uniref:FtsX-like permease family protein n=1 Tax=Robinsoniella sp. KNHs210 TaxID=1469950 RepID=UPI000483B680|nr:ABC transporter permease [Robinsoniella sp. KNHs210]